MAQNPNIPKIKIKGIGRVEWERAFEAKIPSVVVRGEGKQDKLEGKNLLNFKTAVSGYACNVTVLDNGFRAEKITPSASAWVQIAVSLKKDVKYTLSGFINTKTGQKPVIGVFRKDTTFITWVGDYPSGGKVNSTFQINEEGNFYLFFYVDDSKDGAVGDYTEFLNLQLELGSTPTPYEPYCGGIPAPNPQYSIDPVFLEGASIMDGTNTAPLPILRALPDGSVRDEMDVVSGTVVRRIGVKEFDGSEPWYSWEGKAVALANWVNGLAIDISWSKLKGYLSNVAREKTSDRPVPTDNSFTAQGNFWIAFRVNYTLEEWKSYLAEMKTKGTSVTVWYILKDPIIEHYDPAVLRQHPGYTQLIQQGGFRGAEIEADVYTPKEA